MTAMGRLIGAGILTLLAFPASARGGWDCTYHGYGDDPARYVARLERRGGELVEPHWPAAIAYRVLVDTGDVLIAVHAYAIPPSFRRDAGGSATVLIINKINGHLRRSTSASGETEQILEGSCRRT